MAQLHCGIFIVLFPLAHRRMRFFLDKGQRTFRLLPGKTVPFWIESGI